MSSKMTPRLVGTGLPVGLLLVVLQAHPFAQQTTASSPTVPNDPVFFVGADYSRLVHFSFEAGTVIPVGDQSKGVFASGHGDIAQARHGIELSANAGQRGFQVAGGFGEIATEGSPIMTFGFDLLGTVGKLNSRATWPNSTYVGVDAGFTLLIVHGSLGVAYRVNGASNQSHWTFAPTVGVVIPFGRRWYSERVVHSLLAAGAR